LDERWPKTRKRENGMVGGVVPERSMEERRTRGICGGEKREVWIRRVWVGGGRPVSNFERGKVSSGTSRHGVPLLFFLKIIEI
jgi:hypothetical protein